MTLPLVRPEEWVEEALCARSDPEVWFPEKGGSQKPAKDICNGTEFVKPCPVRQQCLLYALEHDEQFGVWAGLSQAELKRLRKLREQNRPPVPRLRPISHGTEAGARAHRSRGEDVCDYCLEGARLHRRVRAA